jgi:hypothetical protein
MTISINEDHHRLISGPLYEHSQRAAALLQPLLPSNADLQAEFTAELRRRVDGVEMSPASAAAACMVVEVSTGVTDVFKRQRLYGRLDVDDLDDGRIADRLDEIRGGALGLARLFAAHVHAQIVGVRGPRMTEGPRAPIILSIHDTIPKLLCRYGDEEPLICVDHISRSLIALFAAHYFVTPLGVAPRTS